MGLLDRLKETFSSGDDAASRGVEYQCTDCGAVFDTARDRCPECGETDIRERGSFEFRPQ